MSKVSDILKNFQLFVDGRGYAGNCDEFTPPKLVVILEDYRNGGLDGAVGIDMGMENMEASLVMSKVDKDLFRLWGLQDGAETQLTLRGALETWGETTAKKVELNCTGRIFSVEWPSIKAGEKAAVTFSMRLTYYRHRQDGEDLHEIDVINMVRKVNGVDRLASIRNAIGL